MMEKELGTFLICALILLMGVGVLINDFMKNADRIAANHQKKMRGTVAFDPKLEPSDFFTRGQAREIILGYPFFPITDEKQIANDKIIAKMVVTLRHAHEDWKNAKARSEDVSGPEEDTRLNRRLHESYQVQSEDYEVGTYNVEEEIRIRDLEYERKHHIWRIESFIAELEHWFEYRNIKLPADIPRLKDIEDGARPYIPFFS